MATGRAVDNRGRSAGRQRGKNYKIQEQFVPLRVSLIESAAWRTMSLSSRRALERICIEHTRHGGVENGDLIVTFDDFSAWGMDRHSIRPALDQLVALGLLVISPGRAGNGDFRRANRFRVTFLPTRNEAPTDDWKRIETIDVAKQAIATAGADAPRRSPERMARTA